jgi:hypothetical protein
MGHRRRRARVLAVLATWALLVVGSKAHAGDEATGRIERVELKAEGPSAKVIVMLSRPIAFNVHVLNPDPAKNAGRRLLLDFTDTTIAPEAAAPIEVKNDLLRQVRTGQFNAKTARLVLELGNDATHSVDAFESPPHVTISLAGPSTAAAPPSVTNAAPVEAPAPADAAAPEVPVSAPVAEPSKSAVRTIPVRARWRKPYSLNYGR